MKTRWTVFLRRVGGTAVFLLGVIGCILPIIPGFPLIGVGLYLLSLDSPGMQSRIRALRLRYPRVDRFVHKIEHSLGAKIPGGSDEDNVPYTRTEV
jgi:uncharacterized protein YqgC (DUF456 family)